MNPPHPYPCRACEIEGGKQRHIRHLVIARRLLAELRSLAPKYVEDAASVAYLLETAAPSLPTAREVLEELRANIRPGKPSGRDDFYDGAVTEAELFRRMIDTKL